MIVAVDIGNSDIVTGIYENSTWKEPWRIASQPVLTAAEYEKKLRLLCLEHNILSTQIEGIVLSSVVPDLVQPLRDAWQRLTGLEVFVVKAELLEKIELTIANKEEIGTDLVANAVAAYDLFKCGCLVVDFGTALTFTTVNDHKEIIGVSIAPGLKTTIKALTQNTAKLPEIDLTLPDSAIGKDTVHAIRAGILYGYVGLVKEMIARTKEEMGRDLKVVATGGLSKILHPLRPYFDEIQPLLTLQGLLLIYRAEN